MKLTTIFLGITISACIFFTGCAPNDADIKTKVDAIIKADTMFVGANADVKDGIVTLTGEMKDSICKDMCAKTIREKDIKGVNDVINNTTVKPQPTAPPTLTATIIDDNMQQKIKDDLKEIKGITITFDTERVTLVGEVNETDRIKIMNVLASAKVKSNVDKLITRK
jgi:hyperosmotically inducible protein